VILLTEDEAATKACPVFPARPGRPYEPRTPAEHNIGYGIPTPMKCMGTSCMGWQWGPHAYGDDSPMRGFCGAMRAAAAP
jgi:hypothetical protein